MEYIFYGQAIPSFKRISFDIKNPPLRLSIKSKIGNFNFTLLLNNTSDIVVLIESEKEIIDIPTLVNIVRVYTQSFYDAALLKSGTLSTVIFNSLLLPNKSLAQINNQDISKWYDTKLFDLETELLFKMIFNPIVRIAISDIKFSCIEADLTPFFAFRAIEVIRNSFDEKISVERKDSWILLRENLNIKRTFFNPIEKIAKQNRHGEPCEISFEKRKICIYSAMIVLNRYLHYLNGEKKKLNVDIFSEINSIDDFIK